MSDTIHKSQLVEGAFSFLSTIDEGVVVCMLIDTGMLPYALPYLKNKSAFKCASDAVGNSAAHLLMVGPLMCEEQEILSYGVGAEREEIQECMMNVNRVLQAQDYVLWICVSEHGDLVRYMQSIGQQHDMEVRVRTGSKPSIH